MSGIFREKRGQAGVTGCKMWSRMRAGRQHEVQGRALALTLSLALASLPRQSPLSKTKNMVSM